MAKPQETKTGLLQKDANLARMVKILAEAFHPESIYVFGSAARGERTEDSDYDVLVVLSKSTEPGYRHSQRAHTLLVEADFTEAADILFITREKFERQKKVMGTLAEIVCSEGQELYAA